MATIKDEGMEFEKREPMSKALGKMTAA